MRESVPKCRAECTDWHENKSILRPARIDVLVPQQNPAGHALHVLEALLAQGLRELHRAAAGLAVDDDLFVLVRRQFADALAELLQRDQRRRRRCAVI